MKKYLILSILALISGCSDSSKISIPIDKPVTKKVQAQNTKETETLYKRMLPGGSWAWMKEPPLPDSNEPVITYEMVRAEEMAQAKKYKEEEDKLNEKLKSWLPSRETYGQFYSGVVENYQIYQQGLSEDSWQYVSPDWRLRYNPFDNKWQYASPDSRLRYNPFDNKWQYASPDSRLRYNPFDSTWQYVPSR